MAGQLIGESPAFRAVRAQIQQYGGCGAPVLIQGETGTGKELAARALHYLSDRRGGPFVAVKLGALGEALVANELFGHERGAFTGADSRASGLIDEAEGGTLFLDEIDSLPLSAQAALLRFLQEEEYRPLGGRRQKRADVRVVSASIADIAALVAAKRFREDLHYRLNVLGLRLPPLRERKSDVPLLAEHFITRLLLRYGGPARTLSASARAAMQVHDWPGTFVSSRTACIAPCCSPRAMR